jgi:hypothetical protein
LTIDAGNSDVLKFENDLKIGDGYKKFASELTRISLVAIGACATLWIKLKSTGPVQLPATYGWLYAAFAALSVSAMLSLAHLYYANDSLACELSYRRKVAMERSDACEERARRNILFRRCGWLLAASVILLAAGVLLFIAGVTTVLSLAEMKPPT